MTTQSRYLRIQNEADAILELLREIVAPFEGVSATDIGYAQQGATKSGDRIRFDYLGATLKARAILARIDGGV